MNKYSYQILNYLKEHGDSSATEIAKEFQLSKRFVDACFSADIMNAGMGERDQSVTPSILRLNEKGKTYVQEEE